MRHILCPLLILLLVWTGCTATHRVKTMSLSPTPLPTDEGYSLPRANYRSCNSYTIANP